MSSDEAFTELLAWHYCIHNLKSEDGACTRQSRDATKEAANIIIEATNDHLVTIDFRCC